MTNQPSISTDIARRRFLYQLNAGVGAVALSSLLQSESARASTSAANPLAPKAPHFPARAKSIIFMVMEGGASQVDTFDPKPALEKIDGQVFKRSDTKSNQVKGTRYAVRSPFEFKKYGECGAEVSELFSHTAKHVDDMAIVRSAYADSDNHPAALFHYNTGHPVQGHPSMGAWMTYGLGTENQNLPAFVVLRDGKPFGGTSCWANGYLPAAFQGTQFRGGDRPVLDLENRSLTRAEQRQNLDLVNQVNAIHQRTHSGHSELDARIAAYELAFRMQTEIPLVADFQAESAATKQLYGIDDNATRAFGSRCLLARRLVERGVRFVQLWSSGWDSHDDVKNGQTNAARQVDKPIAGLLTDLKQRGLLNETLVVWGGEFGRTPDTTEPAFNRKRPGRDHNPSAMTMWFAGAGVKGGTIIGATDEFGGKAAVQPYHLRDIHATLLTLMGLDQEQLTYYHAGRFMRLTDTGGTVIRDMIA